MRKSGTPPFFEMSQQSEERGARAGASGSRSALPLFVQIIALLIAGIMLAQLLNVAVVLSSPAPPPVRYAPGQIADLLAGTARPGDISKFVISRRNASPPDAWEDPEEREFRIILARLLRAPADHVRVVLRYAGAVPGANGTSLAPPPLPRILNPFRQPGETNHFAAGVLTPGGTWLVAEPRDESLFHPWQKRLLLWFLGTAVLVALLGYVFARRLTAPITRFAAAAERLGRDPSAPPLDLHGPAEIGAAASAFNGMQERLQRYVENRTAMIGAIAHDLRTPLTRLRFRLEAAPEPLRAKAAADIEEMEAMIAATLRFVRDTTRPGPRERLELRSLIESIADNMVETGQDAAVEPGEPIIVCGNPIALRGLFTNLMDNAVKYGGRVRASAVTEGNEAVIRVEDDGPGLPEEELGQVFEPFYRAERSRSRDTGGIGLGLSVARSIAHAHGGDIRLENRLEGGLRATVRLPL